MIKLRSAEEVVDAICGVMEVIKGGHRHACLISAIAARDREIVEAAIYAANNNKCCAIDWCGHTPAEQIEITIRALLPDEEKK